MIPTRSYRTVAAVALTLLALAPSPLAQPAHEYRVTRAADGLRLVPTSGTISDVEVAADGGTALTFNCAQDSAPPVDCQQLSASVVDAAGGTTMRLQTTRTAAKATMTIPADALGDLTVRIGSDGVSPSLRLVAPGRVDSSEPVTVVRRGEVECAAAAGLAGRYDTRADRAEVVVAPDGFVIARPPLPMDEDDLLVVHVVGDPDVLATALVVRTSATRAVGKFQSLGDEVVGTIERQAFSGACGVARAELADFASGEGTFRITTTDPDGNKTATADVSVRVNPVYRGAFAFGPVLTGARDRAYELLADSTVSESVTGKSEGVYVLSYTYFLGGPYDVEKTGSVGVNPMIGISLTSPLESVFAGATIDLSRGAAYLMVGLHGREVTRLLDRDGLAVGERLPADLDSVPTREVWEWHPFGGFGIDVRAAIGLFGKALTGGG